MRAHQQGGGATEVAKNAWAWMRVAELRWDEAMAWTDNPHSLKSAPRPAVLWAAVACLVTVLLGGMACSEADSAVNWGYDGVGAPEHWASLSEGYATCANGRQQSPIDIAGYDSSDTSPIAFAYRDMTGSIRNDGRFVHVDFAPGNTLSVGQRTYALKSAHFHSPSEHLIEGKSFAAELHLVHADADGNLAVVGLLFSLGAPSPVAQKVLDAAPAIGNTVAEGFSLNAALLMPGDLGLYRYDGSKTTPPCDEPVDWFVMRQPQTISQEQVDGLLTLSGGPNNRPVQPIGSRTITSASGAGSVP